MLWLAPSPALLASKSAVRRQMLEAAGVPVEVRPADIDERAIEQDAGTANSGRIAALLAAAKAVAAGQGTPDRLVIAADQTLACEGRVFHKPENRAAARRQLAALRGRTHTLTAAVAVHVAGAVTFEHADSVHLTMRAFSDAFLDRYLDEAGDRVLQSVGGYQLEGLGIQLFERIEGDYFTILGLPLLPLLGYLRQAGFLLD